MIARALTLALILAAPVAARRDDPLAGRVAGKPVDCITLSTGTSPEIVDDRTILYREGGRIWRTGPIGTCPSLRPQQILIVRSFGGQLCRNDRFQLLAPQTTIPSGFCRFGRFTPYSRPAR